MEANRAGRGNARLGGSGVGRQDLGRLAGGRRAVASGSHRGHRLQAQQTEDIAELERGENAAVQGHPYNKLYFSIDMTPPLA